MAPPAYKRRRPAMQLLPSSYLYVDKDTMSSQKIKIYELLVRERYIRAKDVAVTIVYL
jgi:hypothetical protein